MQVEAETCNLSFFHEFPFQIVPLVSYSAIATKAGIFLAKAREASRKFLILGIEKIIELKFSLFLTRGGHSFRFPGVIPS